MEYHGNGKTVGKYIPILIVGGILLLTALPVFGAVLILAVPAAYVYMRYGDNIKGAWKSFKEKTVNFFKRGKNEYSQNEIRKLIIEYDENKHNNI